MITREFQPNASLYYRASREIFRLTSAGKWLSRVFIFMPVLLVATTLIQWQATGTLNSPYGLVVAAGSLIFIFFWLPFMQYRTIAKNLKSNPSAAARQQYEISETGLRNRGDGFSVDLSWARITQVSLSKTFLLFFISRNVAYFIPRDILSEEEIGQIREWKKSNQ